MFYRTNYSFVNKVLVLPCSAEYQFEACLVSSLVPVLINDQENSHRLILHAFRSKDQGHGLLCFLPHNYVRTSKAELYGFG